MKPEDVRQQMQLFLSYMREEQELRDRLISLDLSAGSEEQVKEALSEQTAIFASIEALRQEKMLPLLAGLAKFVESSREAFDQLPPEQKRALIAQMAAPPQGRVEPPAKVAWPKAIKSDVQPSAAVSAVSSPVSSPARSGGAEVSAGAGTDLAPAPKLGRGRRPAPRGDGSPKR